MITKSVNKLTLNLFKIYVEVKIRQNAEKIKLANLFLESAISSLMNWTKNAGWHVKGESVERVHHASRANNLDHTSLLKTNTKIN